MSDSYTTVEGNIFYHCNGEIEVISNKSGHNTIRNNMLYECTGTITLREGNFATVCGNYFIGNGIKETGGIRIIGENHKVRNNYFQGLTGTGLRAAISIMDAMPNSALSGYMQVKNPEVKNNTIINCAQAFEIGAGKRAGRDVAPQNVTLADNVVLGSQPITYTDKPQGIKITGNILYNIKLSGDLPDGFDMKDPKMEVNGLNVFQPATNSKIGAPALSTDQKQLFSATGIGPVWFKGLPAIRAK